MSEGTPGRGPDADSRTDVDEGQGSTIGRPSPQPVRYGPRNGASRGGPDGDGTTSGRTVPASSSPQYRAPQPPQGSQGSANGGPGPGTDTASANGSRSAALDGAGLNGAGANGAGANGASPNGAGGQTQTSSAQPRNGLPNQPDLSEEDRRVADARTAAAARNASVAKVRGGPALLGADTAPTAEREAAPQAASQPAPAEDTAAVPAAGTGDEVASAPPTAAGSSTAPETASEVGKTPGLFGRLRSRERGNSLEDTTLAVPAPAASVDPATVPAAGASLAGDQLEPKVAERADANVAEKQADQPVDASSPEPDESTQERPLTWRDRLGLPPKSPRPVPADGGAGVPTAAAAAAADTAPQETDDDSPTAPTSAPQAVPLHGRLTPSSSVPEAASDTAVIPTVEAGTGSPGTPAAGATAAPLADAKPKVGTARRTRKARLRLSRVDPWSVMKTAFLFSIAAGIILVVATYGVWSVLNASGLFAAVDDMVKSVVSTPGDTTPFRIEEYVNTQKILGVAAIIAVVDVLIFTALATLGSFLYNLAATVLGGLEVTLAED